MISVDESANESLEGRLFYITFVREREREREREKSRLLHPILDGKRELHKNQDYQESREEHENNSEKETE
jgi:hypothetical protein